jgi:type IV secretion system protein VirB4
MQTRTRSGELTKKIGVFNLQALRDDPKAMTPVQTDILYRITQAFEDPDLRHVPKLLDIDECHFPLSIPSFAQYVVQKIRTWGKWFGSMQMWTQSPEELEKPDGWAAIRSAATTFVFMADPNMDEGLYKRTFPFLTAGECAAIRNLIPKREAYVIQHELGISKTVVIDVEPEQRVVNTSHPREAALRDSLIKEYGFEEGLRRAVVQLSAIKPGDGEAEVASRLKLVNSN